MAEYMLTTVDNPFDPFTQYEEWYAYDLRLGYHTPSYLARMTITSDELSEGDQAKDIDDAMNAIVLSDISGLYRKVAKPAS